MRRPSKEEIPLNNAVEALWDPPRIRVIWKLLNTPELMSVTAHSLCMQ